MGYQKLPNCNDDTARSIPQGVTACVVRTPATARIAGGLTFEVKARAPSGRWAVRRRGPDVATVVPLSNGGFRADDPTKLGPVQRLNLTDAAHCGPDTDPAWTLATRWRDRGANDHSVGWWPSSGGKARGVSVNAGDLGRLQGSDLGLEVVSGQPRGLVQAVRHESATVRWEGLARVGPSDLSPAGTSGQPAWRILDATPLSFTWRKFSNDQVVESGVEATIRQLVEGRSPARQPGAAPDQLGFAFGCAGERVLIDDLRVYRTGDGRDDLYDFEAPRPTINFLTKPSRLNCLTSASHYPNRHKQLVRFSHNVRWQVSWRPGNAFDGRVISDGSAATGRAKLPFKLKRSGQLAISTLGSAALRARSTGRYSIKAVPKVALHKVTRRVPVGRRIVLTGRVQPGGVRTVGLHLQRGTGLFPQRTADKARTTRKGTFRLSVRAPSRPGRYALAVKVVGRGGLETAMSNRALFMQVFRPPPAPVAVSVPQPVVTQPLRSESVPILPPPVEFARSRAGGCGYKIR